MNNKIMIRGINTLATGAKIHNLRKNSGYTVEALCDIFLISPQAIYKWQKGEALPTLENLFVLSDIFNVKIEDIVVREDTMSSF